MFNSQRNLKKATVQGVGWNYATFIGSKGLVFITTIILARHLDPDDFGLLALAMVAVNYLDTLGDIGISDAMIYRQSDPERAYHSAFFINLITGLITTTIGFLAAPLVAEILDEPRVTPILQVLSLTFVFSSLGYLLESRFKKELDFRSKFIVLVGKAVIKGGVSIVMALTGFGVWSLVGGQLAGTIAGTLLFWIRSKWMPRFVFDWQITKSLFGYGSQLILVEIIGMIHKNLDYLIVGYLLGTEALGYYTMGFRLPELVVIYICYIFGQTLFPAFSKLQNDLDGLRKGYLESVQYLVLLTIPGSLLLFLIAPEFVNFFYGDKWSEAIKVTQALSIYALVYSLSYTAGDVYKATGQPSVLNKIGVLKLALTIPALWFAAQYNILFVAIAQLLTTVILTIVRLVIAGKIIGFTVSDFLVAIRPAAISSMIMFIIGIILRQQLIGLHPLIILSILGIVGGISFISALWLIDRRLLLNVVRLIQNNFLSRISVRNEAVG